MVNKISHNKDFLTYFRFTWFIFDKTKIFFYRNVVIYHITEMSQINHRHLTTLKYYCIVRYLKINLHLELRLRYIAYALKQIKFELIAILNHKLRQLNKSVIPISLKIMKDFIMDFWQSIEITLRFRITDF